MISTSAAGPYFARHAAPMQEFGVIGLGRMGGGLAHQALRKGLRIVGASRTGAAREPGRGDLPKGLR